MGPQSCATEPHPCISAAMSGEPRPPQRPPEKIELDGRTRVAASRRLLLQEGMSFAEMQRRTRLIALTGGIGAGKSTVGSFLSELGAEVIDTDKVAHASYQPGSEGFAKVVSAFGPKILSTDGTIDRKKLAQIVFADRGARERLNAIVHPLVAAEVQRRIADHWSSGSRLPIVLEIPLLVESRALWSVDQIWVVTARRETVLERLLAKGMDRAQAEVRIETQASDEERLKYATVVIENDGDLAALKRRVQECWANFTRADAPGATEGGGLGPTEKGP